MSIYLFLWLLIFLISFFVIFLVIFLVAEIISYALHAWIFHKDILHESHKIHHDYVPEKKKFENEEDNYGVSDFIYVLIFIIFVYSLFLFVLSFVSFPLVTMLVGVVFICAFLSFTLIYYVHTLYHTKNAWPLNVPLLNKLFEKTRKLHYLHHENPKVNYGIVMPLMDKLFGTYMDGCEDKSKDK